MVRLRFWFNLVRGERLMSYGLMMFLAAVAIGMAETAVHIRLMPFLVISAVLACAVAMTGFGLGSLVLTWVALQLGYAFGLFLFSRIRAPQEAGSKHQYWASRRESGARG
jgi:hypothetical protein